MVVLQSPPSLSAELITADGGPRRAASLCSYDQSLGNGTGAGARNFRAVRAKGHGSSWVSPQRPRAWIGFRYANETAP